MDSAKKSGASGRKHRRPPPTPDQRSAWGSTPVHNQYTFEGQIDQLGAFATAAAARPGCRRAALIALTVTLLLVLVSLAERLPLT